MRTFPSLLRKLALPTLLLCSSIAAAGTTALFVVDDMVDLGAILDSANNAVMATSDTPVVVIFKDTHVSEVMRGSTAEREVAEALAGGVRMFVCEADILASGLRVANVMSKVTIVPAAVVDDEAGTLPAKARPGEKVPSKKAADVKKPQLLERFSKIAEKVCSQ